MHVAGVLICSLLAYAIWIASSAVAFSPIIARGDDSPRTFEALPVYIRFCSYLSEAMCYPFLWIRPGSTLDGSHALVLMALFWGGILYLPFYAIRRLRPNVA